MRLPGRGLALMLLAQAAFGAEPDAVDVRLASRGSKAYDVEGAFEVDASSALVWEVLTNYDGLPRFVSGMRRSHVTELRPDDSLLVEQEARGGALFFSREVHLLLEVRRAGDVLRFQDQARRDFRVYEGSWEARTSSAATRVTYRLHIEPGFFVPGFLLRRGFQRVAAELLSQVRAEILRRRATDLGALRGGASRLGHGKVPLKRQIDIIRPGFHGRFHGEVRQEA